MSSAKPSGLAQVMQVFISSPSKEMEAYRQEAIRAIKAASMLHKNFNDPKGAGFTQGARSIFELNRDTIKSCDVLVGLYGFGGVWRPATHPGLRDIHPELLSSPEKMIMEYEYEWAKEGGLYLFPFVRTDETRGAAFVPLDPRMDAFRTRLMAGTVGWLATPDAFYKQLTDSLMTIRPRIFLSYSKKNADYAGGVQLQLRGEDLHAWRDETSIPGGAEWKAVIEAAIEQTDVLVVVLTPESARSEWVEKECTSFLRRGKAVIPYITDEAIKSGIPKYLESIQFIDGTKSQGFPGLVKQLRAALGG